MGYFILLNKPFIIAVLLLAILYHFVKTGNAWFCGLCNHFIASASSPMSQKLTYGKNYRSNATLNKDCPEKVSLQEVKLGNKTITVTTMKDAEVEDSENRTMDNVYCEGYAQSEVTCYFCKRQLGWKHVPQITGLTFYTLFVFQDTIDKAMKSNGIFDHGMENVTCVCWKGLRLKSGIKKWLRRHFSKQRQTINYIAQNDAISISGASTSNCSDENAENKSNSSTTNVRNIFPYATFNNSTINNNGGNTNIITPETKQKQSFKNRLLNSLKKLLRCFCCISAQATESS